MRYIKCSERKKRRLLFCLSATESPCHQLMESHQAATVFSRQRMGREGEEQADGRETEVACRRDVNFMSVVVCQAEVTLRYTVAV